MEVTTALFVNQSVAGTQALLAIAALLVRPISSSFWLSHLSQHHSSQQTLGSETPEPVKLVRCRTKILAAVCQGS